MGKLQFYIVDVFAEKRFSGNQLAVFTDAGHLTDDEMQAIARETNFSETTFIMKDLGARTYEVRIYTPEYEVPFAGHPTLGTAYIIRSKLLNRQEGDIFLQLKAGKIPVTYTQNPDGGETYWMKQLEPEFKDTLSIDRMAQVLNLKPEDFDERFPIQEVSTGLPHIVVPLKGLNALKTIMVSKERYFELINQTWAKNIQVFCAEGHSDLKAISTRMFTDYLGIPEDPATGSGNGCLAGYLIRHRYFGTSSIDIRSEQGYEMGRPSVLYLKASESEGKIDVHVGGNVVPIAEGFFI